MATNTNLGTKTNMKTTKETNPFGVIHFNLHSKLYKAGKYAQAQFNRNRPAEPCGARGAGGIYLHWVSEPADS